jgi:hypothetical protein
MKLSESEPNFVCVYEVLYYIENIAKGFKYHISSYSINCISPTSVSVSGIFWGSHPLISVQKIALAYSFLLLLTSAPTDAARAVFWSAEQALSSDGAPASRIAAASLSAEQKACTRGSGSRRISIF